MFRRYVISAIFRRNVASYFSGVLGYLFIIAFVIVGGLLSRLLLSIFLAPVLYAIVAREDDVLKV